MRNLCDFHYFCGQGFGWDCGWGATAACHCVGETMLAVVDAALWVTCWVRDVPGFGAETVNPYWMLKQTNRSRSSVAQRKQCMGYGDISTAVLGLRSSKNPVKCWLHILAVWGPHPKRGSNVSIYHVTCKKIAIGVSFVKLQPLKK